VDSVIRAGTKIRTHGVSSLEPYPSHGDTLPSLSLFDRISVLYVLQNLQVDFIWYRLQTSWKKISIARIPECLKQDEFFSVTVPLSLIFVESEFPNRGKNFTPVSLLSFFVFDVDAKD